MILAILIVMSVSEIAMMRRVTYLFLANRDIALTMRQNIITVMAKEDQEELVHIILIMIILKRCAQNLAVETLEKEFQHSQMGLWDNALKRTRDYKSN